MHFSSLWRCPAGRWSRFLPLGESDTAESFWAATHLYLAYVGIGVVAFHIVAALRHHFWLKDAVLARMITPSSDDGAE